MGERAIRRRLIFTTLLIPLMLLAACSHKLSRHAPPPQPTTGKAQLPDGSGGIYKTGNPYRVMGRMYKPLSSAEHYDETGVASWYGSDFHGKKTANGERYDMHALSAAHKTLPLPTLVRVTNLDNGRSVIVRVNDRGPFVKDRLIDLSRAAADELGYMHNGTTRVRVQTLDIDTMPAAAPSPPVATPPFATPPLATPPVAAPLPASPSLPATAGSASNIQSDNKADAGHIFIQLASFGSRANAERMRDSLLPEYPNADIMEIEVSARTYYRVRIGPFNDSKELEKTVISLQQNGFRDTIVVNQ